MANSVPERLDTTTPDCSEKACPVARTDGLRGLWKLNAVENKKSLNMLEAQESGKWNACLLDLKFKIRYVMNR